MWSSTICCAVLLATVASIHAATSNFIDCEPVSKYAPIAAEDSVIPNKPVRSFNILKLGGGYGVEKRYAPQSDKSDTQIAKHRRGPLNGLIPGGGFGRAAKRSDLSSIKVMNPYLFEKIRKAVRGVLENEWQAFDMFDVENRKDFDGQAPTSSRAFMEKISLMEPQSVDIPYNTNNQY